MENRQEQTLIINPFSGSKLDVKKVIDENRKSEDWWKDYLEFHVEEDENEFYILFDDGLLVKKGRSKFKTSQYLIDEKRISFRKFYEKV